MLTAALLGSLAPALVAGAVLALGWRAGRPWVAALAVAAGYVAGHAAIIGVPPLPPIDATHWAFHVAWMAGLVAFLPGSARRALLALGVPVIVLWPRISQAWSVGVSAAWLIGSALVLYSSAAGLESLEGRRAARCLPLGLTVGVSLASVTLLLSGSALVAQLAGALAATLGALTVGTWLWPERSPSGAVLPFLAIFSTLLLVGIHYVEMPLASAILLVLFPLSVALVDLGALRRLPNAAAFAGAALLGGAPAALAALIAWSARPTGGGY